MFIENMINLTWCIIFKMQSFREDKFSAGRTKCRSPMLKWTWWISLALFLIVNLKPYLGLDLINPRSSLISSQVTPGSCLGTLRWESCHWLTVSIPPSLSVLHPYSSWQWTSSNAIISPDKNLTRFIWTHENKRLSDRRFKYFITSII